MKNYVCLRLEGPMQSWGCHTNWDHKPTYKMPTRSAIVGLMSCALGYLREDPKILQLEKNILSFTVREDRAGHISSDFQTIEGKPLLNTMHVARSGGNRLTSTREYIYDASYLVFVEFKDNEIRNKVVSALKAPKWNLFLGRKCCVPSKPVYEGICHAEDIFEALMLYNVEDYKAAERKFETDDVVAKTMNCFIRCSKLDKIGSVNLRTFNKRYVYCGKINCVAK